jgi:hypothetical protein
MNRVALNGLEPKLAPVRAIFSAAALQGILAMDAQLHLKQGCETVTFFEVIFQKSKVPSPLPGNGIPQFETTSIQSIASSGI